MSSAAEKVLRAFVEAFSADDGYVVLRQRGGTPGYVHVVPSGFDPSKRGHRHVVVELKNGAVGVTLKLRDVLGAQDRPQEPIDKHDLGYSAGPSFGRFKWGLTHGAILAKWGSERAFAQTVNKRLREVLASEGAEEEEGDYT